jgi:aminoglycoside/choline kinase family phosphotransferase
MHDDPATIAYADQVPPYDEGKLLNEANLLVDWFLPAHIGHPIAPPAKRAYEAIWRDLVPIMLGAGRTLTLRDFFADNLMWLPDRAGTRVVGLLDYQDALAGSPAYDLMSLIEDARRDLAPDLEAGLRARYRAARKNLDTVAFDAAYVALAAQRHAKVIGIFTRLAVRDGKFGYLAHIPRVWRLLERACRDPRLAALKDWLDVNAPVALRCAPELREAAQ